MKVLSIDPGINTGICIVDVANNKLLTYVEKKYFNVWKLLTSAKWNCVIYEQFSSAGRISGYGQQTIRIVGGIQAICYVNNLHVCEHTPQFKLAFMDQASAVLRKLNGKVTSEHEKDAIAHYIAHQEFHHK